MVHPRCPYALVGIIEHVMERYGGAGGVENVITEVLLLHVASMLLYRIEPTSNLHKYICFGRFASRVRSECSKKG